MIGHLECEEPLQVRVSYDSGHESVEVYIRFSGCAGCLVGQVEHFKGRGFYFKCKTYQTALTVLAVLEIYFFVWIRNQQAVTFVLSFISLLQVALHVSGNHVPIFRS